MTLLRRLDHVAVLVRDTDEALRFYSGRLGLAVASSEEIRARTFGSRTWMRATPTYSSCTRSTATRRSRSGSTSTAKGLHHICFGVDDVAGAVGELSDPGAEISLGQGRGRVSSFISVGGSHGVRIECTEFVRARDVDGTPGYLDGRSG